MTRVHDMGGRFGDGPVRPEPEDAPVRTVHLQESIHGEEDGPHAWAWSRDDVSYLYVLMPIRGGDRNVAFDSLADWRNGEQGDVPEGVEEVSGGEGPEEV